MLGFSELGAAVALVPPADVAEMEGRLTLIEEERATISGRLGSDGAGVGGWGGIARGSGFSGFVR